MPKISTPLTFAQIKSLKPKEKLYKKSDGGGLSLWIYPSGAMKWALSYRLNDKQNTVYLGGYDGRNCVHRLNIALWEFPQRGWICLG